MIRRECEIPAIVDGGIQTGRDLVTALASGAVAGQVGRSYLYGLMAGGRYGVTIALELLIEELQRTMILLGISRITDVNEDCLVTPQIRA